MPDHAEVKVHKSALMVKSRYLALAWPILATCILCMYCQFMDSGAHLYRETHWPCRSEFYIASIGDDVSGIRKYALEQLCVKHVLRVPEFLSRLHTNFCIHLHLIFNIGSYHDMENLLEKLDSSSKMDTESVAGI